ncbi:MAG: hypothetical protein ABIA47_01855 [bacterium]
MNALAFLTPEEQALPEAERYLARRARELKVISPKLYDVLQLDELDARQLRAFFRALELLSFIRICPSHVAIAYTKDTDMLKAEISKFSYEEFMMLQGCVCGCFGPEALREAIRMKIALVLRVLRIAGSGKV